jgi:hypothetical protein
MDRGPHEYRFHRPKDEAKTTIKYRERGAYSTIYWSPDLSARSSVTFNKLKTCWSRWRQSSCHRLQVQCVSSRISQGAGRSSCRNAWKCMKASSSKHAKPARLSHLTLGSGQQHHRRRSSVMKRTGNGGASTDFTQTLMAFRQQYLIIG